MLGIAVLLLLSWLILYLVFRQDLLQLGLVLTRSTFKVFLFGFLISLTLCALQKLGEWQLSSTSLQLSESFSWMNLLLGLGWDFRSVLTEELLFRGALFYILWKKMNANWAIALSAISFGVYHWFSFGIIGQLVPMIVIFIGTGLMGFAFALAFVRTKTIYAPLGLHLGWNFCLNTIFSSGPHSLGVFSLQDGTSPTWYALLALIGVPLLLLSIVYKTYGRRQLL